VRNPRYWNPQLPYLDGIKLSYYADDSTIALNVQGGQQQVWPVAPFRARKRCCATRPESDKVGPSTVMVG